jgi:threonine aldolase
MRIKIQKHCDKFSVCYYKEIGVTKTNIILNKKKFIEKYSTDGKFLFELVYRLKKIMKNLIYVFMKQFNQNVVFLFILKELIKMKNVKK